MKKTFKAAVAASSTAMMTAGVLGLAGTVPFGVAAACFALASAACVNAVMALWRLWQAEGIRRAEAEKAAWKRDFFRNCR